MNLQTKVAAWNGKSVDDITAIFQAYHAEPEFIDELVSLITRSKCQKGATWLIKAWLERGNQLSEEQTEAIFNSLNILEGWESRLHVLQSLPFLKISENKKKAVEAFLRKTLTDQNKFVRAWSYNGFYELSMQYPEYKQETKQFFEMAMQDEAASIKARIRNLIKEGFG